MTPHFSLKEFNTFGLDAQAAHWVTFGSVAELRSVLKTAPRPWMVLGGGSNVVFVHNWPGTILHNRIRGFRLLRVFRRKVWVQAGGGDSWHQFVQWTLAQRFGGLENLSLIPGTVGAAPIQNIGAYGVELNDVFVRLEAVHLETGEKRVFHKDECRFGYRDSIFKHEAKGQYAITRVTFSLTLPPHRVNIQYGDIRRQLDAMGATHPDINDVSQAVVAIRSAKLPDPSVIGNCGSFFKNPEITAEAWAQLKEKHPETPHFPLPDGRVKVPAGWLIEQCGWKGKRVGNTGAYEKQALVLVNYGGATGAEVKALAEAIQGSVVERFGVRLETEVNLV
ncbi:MAG: UDP-N-acetylmuramate dehydrogenase [Saprospiraceae bacterium]|nr:UDP-N-acetylmuramate dehydrogenase [Saprospiraceae bacterium]